MSQTVSSTANFGKGVVLVQIDENNVDQRLDNFLISKLKGVPKALIYRIIRKGEVRVNKKRPKPDQKLKVGDVVRVPPVNVAEGQSLPQAISASLRSALESAILYESESILVVNKPAGLAVHGGSGINLGLIEALRVMYPSQRFLELVHRLDRDTSGCILIAKKRSALKSLHEQLVEKKVNKIYHALVLGKWPSHLKEVDAPLQKNELRSGERVVRVGVDGKPSKTRFRVLERMSAHTLVEASPITGRTHQIRVHAQFSGCPLVGDDKYGEDPVGEKQQFGNARRLMLHAQQLTFFDVATKKKVQVQAEYDQRFIDVLKLVRS